MAISSALSLVIPAQVGTQLIQRLETKVAGEIAPLGITLLDQPQLPLPVPFLDALLALDCVLHGRMLFEPDQHLHAILAGESFN